MTQFNGNVSVPIDSYDAFKNAVINNGYDEDGAYGDQCWDGADLLWRQLGRNLLTGNGEAIGGWDLERAANAGSDFDIITDVNALQPGDVVFWRPNHVSFFDAYNGGYIRSLGQNQNGLTTGSPFNIVNIAKGSFAGAMRLKRWEEPVTPPAPTPEPAPALKSNDEIAQEVLAGDWGNNPEREQRLTAAGYDYNAIQAIVNGQAAPAPSPSAPTVVIGTHVTTNAVEDSQNHKTLDLAIINDGQSVFSEVNSNGFALLEKDGVIRCAVPVDSLTAV